MVKGKNEKENGISQPIPSDAFSSPLSGKRENISGVVERIAVKNWMQNTSSENETTVSANELTSLSALIAYVAHHSGEKEFGVERRLADRFNVPNVTCLPATKYDSAIRYLVDTMVAA